MSIYILTEIGSSISNSSQCMFDYVSTNNYKTLSKAEI